MYDPFAQAFEPKSRRRSRVDLNQDTKESLVARATKPVMSGISAVGNLLDVPGSMIRDALTLGTNNPQNPFDQLLDPFGRNAETNRVTGRELARSYGLAGNKDTWGNAIGGLALEIGTDPLTYATLGGSALSKAGKVAKNAGLLDDITKVAAKKAGKSIGSIGKAEARSTLSIDDLLNPANFRNQKAHAEAVDSATRAAEKLGTRLSDLTGERLGGTFGLGLPGTGINKTFTTGAKQVDKLSRTVRGSAPVRGLYSLLDASSKGRSTLEGQELAQRITRRQKKSEGVLNAMIAEDAMKLRDLGMADDAASWNIRGVGEGVKPASADPSGLGLKYQDMFKESLQENLALGKKATGELDDVINYMARSAGDRAMGRDGRPLALKDPTALERREALKGFAKGTEHLESIIKDPQIEQIIQAAPNRKTQISDVANYVYSTYGQDIIPTFQKQKQGRLQFTDPSGKVVGLTRDQVKNATPGQNGQIIINNATYDPVLQDRFPVIAKWIVDHPSARQNGLFTNNVLSDTKKRLVSDKKWQEAADEVYDFMADRLSFASTQDGIEIGKVVKKMGIDGKNAMYNVAERMGLNPSQYTGKNLDSFLKQLSKSKIAEDTALDILDVVPKWTSPKAASDFTKFIDGFTNLFKAGVLTFPARYVRDYVSGMARNVESGMWDIGSAVDAHRLSFGKTIDAHKIPVIEKMLRDKNLPVTPEEGSRLLRSLYAGFGPSGNTIATDVAGKVQTPASSLDDILNTVPGKEDMGAGDLLLSMGKTLAGKDGKSSWTDYKNYIRGVGGAKESRLPVVAVGDRVGHYTDEMNRLAPFINQLKKGVDPYEAMNRINAAQVNYAPDSFTPTERALKRIFPFWAFSSRQIPFMAKTLAEKPGGKMAQTIRTMNRARDVDNATPDYVADTASIPIGTLPDGSNRYITGFGLMTEDPLSLVPTSLRGGMMEVASRMNPLIKGPMEYMTGQSFFQKGPMGGRPLEDMDPTIARTIANVNELAGAPKQQRVKPFISPLFEQVMANSPASRALTTARTLTDPRKLSNPLGLGFNLTTGVRMSDISPAAQDAILREQIQEEMKKLGARSFSNIYIPEEEKVGMNPEEREAAETLQAIMKELQDRAKQRKRERQAAAR